MPRIDSFFATLSADEIERAERFQFRKDKEQYVLSRGLLREILSRYSGIHPEKLKFRYGAHGKPFLIVEGQEAGFPFNLSHTQGAVVCAVSRDCEVGVDIECLSPEVKDPVFVERYFSPEEVAVLARLNPDVRQRFVLVCWVRKEAYAKAKGEGLFLNPQNFQVCDSFDAAPRLRIEHNPEEAARWSLVDLNVPADYVAALAMESGHRVCFRHWPRDAESYAS